MASLNVEIEADKVADLMMEDSVFAFELWDTLAERLNMGAMADDLSDLLSTGHNKAHAKWILDQFVQTFDTIKRLHFTDDD